MRTLFAATIVTCLGHHANAQFVAPDLPVGSQYQILFMTYDAMPATSTDIADYNSFVAAEAALDPALPTGVTWNAVISTPMVNANFNSPWDGLSVFNTQGNELASPATGLYNGVGAGSGLLTDVISDQFGTTAPLTGNFGPNVWTGSNAYGYTNFQGQPVGDPSGYANYGYATGFVGDEWINFGLAGPLTNIYHVYALSSPITVVPEPSTIVMVGLGFALLALRGRFVGRPSSQPQSS